MITGVPHYPQYTGEWSSRPHDVLEEVAKAKEVPFLNSYEMIKDKITITEETKFYWTEDPTHFNIEGNRVWAESQIEFLKDIKSNLLRPKSEN